MAKVLLVILSALAIYTAPTVFPYWLNSGKPISAISWLASCYQLFHLVAVGAPLKWISHIFWLKLLKPVICALKSKFPLNEK
jgi:hypothetical protein